MKKRSLLFLTFLMATSASAQIPADAAIRKILADRVGPDNQGIAIVVGVIDSSGSRVISYGSLAKEDKRPVNGDTVFEIGSVTKVFTSLVLMDMMEKHEVAVTDPISKYLPANVKVPERNGRKITLEDLSHQTSGLPAMPDNFKPKDPANPYADYTTQQLYDFLSGYQLTRDIGSKFEYSNLGVGLLGHVLSLRDGRDYESMVKARILDPLGMKSTSITLSADMRSRLALGHGPALNAVPNWDIATLAGAGALRSTANDMLKFLAANLAYVQTPLAAAMAYELSVRKPTGTPNMEIAYGWLFQNRNGNTIVWHNGGTGGYRSYIGFDPGARIGVVVLTNLSTNEGPDDIGRHLIDATYPLLPITPPKEHKEISVDTKTLDQLVGSYELAPGALLTVSRDGDSLFGQLTGQEKLHLYPEGERKFFLKVVDAQLSFDADAQGNITQAVLHQNGRDQTAKRLDDAGAKKAAETAAVLAKRFKDQTQTPGSEAAARRIFGEIRTGQPQYDLMAESFASVIRLQITQLQATLTQLGAIQSMTFKGVGPGGADIYEVKFEHGNIECRIVLEPDGKVSGMGFRPMA